MLCSVGQLLETAPTRWGIRVVLTIHNLDSQEVDVWFRFITMVLNVSHQKSNKNSERRQFFAGSFMKPDDSLRFWKIAKFSKIQVFSNFESDFFSFKWNCVSFKHGNALTINILQQEIKSVKEAFTKLLLLQQ